MYFKLNISKLIACLDNLILVNNVQLCLAIFCLEVPGLNQSLAEDKVSC